MKFNDALIFNFVQGSDISPKSSYDIWRELNPEGTPAQFLAYLGEKEEMVLSNVAANDTNGIVGEANAEVDAQSLMNTVVQKIADLEEIAELIDMI